MKVNSHKLYKLIVTSIVVMILIAMAGAFTAIAAEDFTLVESYPKDGANNAAVENLGVKLDFTSPVDGEANYASNSNCFILKGPNGQLPIKVYNNPKDEKQILVLYDITTGGQLVAKDSETYTLTVSGDLVNKEGVTLGKDQVITFDTINQSRSTRIYMVMMLLMMAGMAAFTVIQTNKKMREEGADVAAKDEPFNPYKEAKRTGKSVSEVLAEHEKEVEKQKAKAEKNKKYYDEIEEEEETRAGVYKVKGPRPISSGGSAYITGRKAEAEARKAEEEARKAEAAARKKSKSRKK